MKNRRLSFDLPTDQPNTIIEVVVRYSKPDNSYVNDRAEAQGYWVGFTPVKKEGSFRVITAYSGTKSLYERAVRFSKKKLDDIMNAVKFDVMVGHSDNHWPTVARRVAEQNGLRITQWDNAIEKMKETAAR